MEETKTITMPLSEYRRMEEIVSSYYSQKEESYESFDKVLKESDYRIEKLLGCKSDDIIYYKNRHNVKGSIIEHIDSLREKLYKVLDKNGDLMHQNYELKCELSKYKQRKWWQIWKK